MADRTNCSLVHLLRYHPPLYCIHDPWILACAEKGQGRPSSPCIPPGKRLLSYMSRLGVMTNGRQWLLRRQRRGRFPPYYENPAAYYDSYPQERGQYAFPQSEYGLQNMPPPVYDPSEPMLPTYQPPAGATKVDPSQSRSPPRRAPAGDEEGSPAHDGLQGPPPAV